MSSVPLQIAETVQSASLNRAPSPAHDLNPSTTASSKQPVSVPNRHKSSMSSSPREKYAYDDEEGIDEDDDDEIPYSLIQPVPRRASFGPLPDLRFEQSYLASIAGAETKWKVAYITLRDQFILPLMQGMLWTLTLHGWRYWNRSTKLQGSSSGARLRRWWYKTNNWPLKETMNDHKVAEKVGEFYQNQSAAAD